MPSLRLPTAAIKILGGVIIAAACTSGSARPTSSPGSPTPTNTAPERTVPVAAADIPVLKPRTGTSVLHPQVRGSGSRRFDPLAVPERYTIMYACGHGGTLLLRVAGQNYATVPCAGDGLVHTEVLRRPPGARVVTIELAAPPITRWALLVTTEVPHP